MSLLFPVSFTLIAEDAAPVCLADALPRVAVAVAVLAARIGDALVAKFAFPAPSASDLKKKEIILKNRSTIDSSLPHYTRVMQR